MDSGSESIMQNGCVVVEIHAFENGCLKGVYENSIFFLTLSADLRVMLCVSVCGVNERIEELREGFWNLVSLCCECECVMSYYRSKWVENEDLVKNEIS